jgi:hypothetical protein
MRYLEYFFAASNAADTARVRRIAERVVAAAGRASPAERRSSFYSSIGERIVYVMRDQLTEEGQLDSLRRNTAAYVALKRANWAKASGERPEALQFPIGASAPPIQGQFWFGRGNATGARPTKGKVALVFVADVAGGHCDPHHTCIAYAALRRLAQRFPSLEITTLTRTEGYFKHTLPSTPAEEADLLWRELHESHGLPGVLAVELTDFWRLPGLDRRRIDRETANQSHYSFGRTWTSKPYGAYLIDPNGVIVEVSAISPDRSGKNGIFDRRMEARFAKLIEILLERQRLAGP